MLTLLERIIQPRIRCWFLSFLFNVLTTVGCVLVFVSFDHYIIHASPIEGFWIFIWNFQTFFKSSYLRTTSRQIFFWHESCVVIINSHKKTQKKTMTYDVGHPGPGLRGIDLKVSVLHIVCYYMSMVDILIYMYFILWQSLQSLIPEDGRLTSWRSTWIYIQVIVFYGRSVMTLFVNLQRLCTLGIPYSITHI